MFIIGVVIQLDASSVELVIVAGGVLLASRRQKSLSMYVVFPL
jgi:hypothetical protein